MTIKNINGIPDTETGRLLIMAIAKITTESQTSSTPDEVLESLEQMKTDVFKDDKVSLKNASSELMKYLNDNYHPHVKVIVDSASAEMLEGIEGTGLVMDYVKD